MAFGVTFGVGLADTTNQATYTTGSFTPAAGDLLLALVVASGATNGSSMSSSVGLTFDRVFEGLTGLLPGLAIFIAKQPAAASAQTVSWTNGSGSASGACVTVLRITGHQRYGVAMIRQITPFANLAASATPVVTFPVAALSTSLAVGLIGNNSNPATLTPPTGWTEDVDTGYATPLTGSEVAHLIGPTGVTTITWASASATAVNVIGIELANGPQRAPQLNQAIQRAANW